MRSLTVYIHSSHLFLAPAVLYDRVIVVHAVGTVRMPTVCVSQPIAAVQWR